MKDQFVPYEIALKLKELGFNKPCFGVWNNPVSEYEVTLVYGGKLHEGYINDLESYKVMSPLWQQAFDWFREEHGFDSWIERYRDDESFIFQIPKANFDRIQGYYTSYEDAREDLLLKLIELKEI